MEVRGAGTTLATPSTEKFLFLISTHTEQQRTQRVGVSANEYRSHYLLMLLTEGGLPPGLAGALEQTLSGSEVFA